MPVRVLVVDDEVPLLELVCGYLVREGWQTETASDGPAGVAAARAWHPPYEVLPPPVTDTERRIGEFVADLVPDSATIQMGIGAIPGAVALALRDKRDLGIHTELFTDYDFVHYNPMVEMRPVDYTNDTTVIRRFRRMTAINSAIEVDLTGQVSADSIGHRLYSGVGGQIDSMRGAALAEEGRAIIALPSTAAGGRVSRITSTLQPGAGVTTTRAHVQTLVTEFGVAELRGRSIAERARALIAIAHPDFRPALAQAARELHYL